MNLEHARETIRSTDAAFPRLVEAAEFLAESDTSSFEDLLACLSRGGLPGERAAIALYMRTNRPRTEGEFVLAESDWRNYLQQEKLM